MAALSPADIAVPIRSLFAHGAQRPCAEGRRAERRRRRPQRRHRQSASSLRLPAARLRRAARVLRPRGLGALRAGLEDARRRRPRSAGACSRRSKRAERDQDVERAAPSSHVRGRRRRPDRRRAGRRDRRDESLHARARFPQHRSAPDARDPGRSRSAHPADRSTRSSRARAMRDLESLGVQVWTSAASPTSTPTACSVGNEHVARSDRAVGGRRARLGRRTHARRADRSGRAASTSAPTSRSPGHPEVFVLGDLARCARRATASRYRASRSSRCRQGIYAATSSSRKSSAAPSPQRAPFRYHDLGQMATIGRSRAIAEFGRAAARRLLRVVVLADRPHLSAERLPQSPVGAVQWAWSYWTFGRGARLIVGKDWQAYPERPPGH